MVAVLGEEVVRGSHEFLRGLLRLAETLCKAARKATSCIMASSSSCGRKEKPCRSACRKVPPGGS